MKGCANCNALATPRPSASLHELEHPIVSPIRALAHLPDTPMPARPTLDTLAEFDACKTRDRLEKVVFIGDIGGTLKQIPEAPCATCGFARMCRDQLLACGVFVNFVDRSKFDRDAPRRPKSKVCRQIFCDQGEGTIYLQVPQSGHRRQATFPLNIQNP